MGYSSEEVRDMTFGELLDLFLVYQHMFNLKAGREVFKEPRKKESMMSASIGWDEVAD